MSQNQCLVPIGSLPLPYEGADNLINGAFPEVRITIKISKLEGDLKRGSLLGMINDGDEKGLYKLIQAEAKDGSSSPLCVLADDYKASEPNPVTAYLTGQFNTRSLIAGTGINISDLALELRKLSIFISTSISRLRP